ncbi:hypothetical protein ACEQPO_08155 [Bacillus sp. SL00103]
MSQLYNAVYQVAGVDDVVIKIGKTRDTLGQSNIEIEPKQVAQVLFSEIEVVHV